MRASKVLRRAVRIGRLKLNPQLDIYNLFNSAAVILYRSSSFATSTYQTPAGILNGRIIGVSLQTRW